MAARNLLVEPRSAGNEETWKTLVARSEVLFDVLNSRSALSGPGNDGQPFAHLQSIIHTDIGREEFGTGRIAF